MKNSNPTSMSAGFVVAGAVAFLVVVGLVFKGKVHF